MKKSSAKKTAFFCTQCGSMHPRWQGQCRQCGAWNALQEETVITVRPSAPSRRRETVAVAIPEISTESQDRIVSGLEEFDRVLGGGAVIGSALLIGGEPGIGKSTLLLQAADSLARSGLKVLYLSGEESPRQIKTRAARFGLEGSDVFVANVTTLEDILELARKDFTVIMIDSIQTVASEAFESPPGTVGQVRECSARLIDLAKKEGKVVFLVGHVTKDGFVAGPKVLEHMVDTVLYFEGDRQHLYRILRAQKNRFGPAGEIGVFEMTGRGLVEVANPSQIFMTHPEGRAWPGRVVSAAIEGNRPFLVEVEALVAASPYGTPQRVASGIDSRRLAIINAVLEKRGGIVLGASDVFVNIAGGIRLDDTGLDLAFLTAVASSRLNVAVGPDMIVIGEIGLSGDVRGVSQLDRRLTEAARLGMRRAVIPKAGLSGLPDFDLDLIPVTGIDDVLQLIR